MACDSLVVSVENDVHLRVMIWRTIKPVTQNPIIFVAGLPQSTVVTCPSNKYMHRAEVMQDIEAFIRKAIK